jgi:hypothetical protein
MNKTILTLTILTIFNFKIVAQDCFSLPPDQSDFCWAKKFLSNSPLHDNLDNSYLKYNIGVNEYYPKGKNVPWGGYYMPLINGGIATRWQVSENSHPTTTTLLTWDKVQKMTIDEIAKLSPSEKMDIYMGNKDFGITKNELTRRGPERSNVESWEGFCNGIRLAGASFTEPQKEILVKSKSGEEIFIKFLPADLKALGGAVYYYNEWYTSLGENNKRKPNAAYFDILLRFVLGNQQRNFFLDIKAGSQKWNETIVGYKREIVKANTSIPQNLIAQGIKQIIDVRTTLYLLGEIGFSETNSQTVPLIENRQLVNTWTTNYKLYVNEENEIVDGKWEKFDLQPINTYLEYPDYVWFGGGKGTDDLVDSTRGDNNVLLSFFEVQNLFYLSIK